MAETILFNGKAYRSVSEMPTEVRQMYERVSQLMSDENQDGIPDLIQSGGLQGLRQAFQIAKDFAQTSPGGGPWTQEALTVIQITDSAITVNGKTFGSVEEMPPEIRAVYEKSLQSATPSSLNIYADDWRSEQPDTAFQSQTSQRSRSPATPSSPVATHETVDSNARFVWLLVAFLVLIGLAAVLWFFFL